MEATKGCFESAVNKVLDYLPARYCWAGTVIARVIMHVVCSFLCDVMTSAIMIDDDSCCGRGCAFRFHHLIAACTAQTVIVAVTCKSS